MIYKSIDKNTSEISVATEINSLDIDLYESMIKKMLTKSLLISKKLIVEMLI